MCREVCILDEDVPTSEDEEQPQIVAVSGLLQPHPCVNDQPQPAATDQAGTLAVPRDATATGLGSRGGKRPRGRPRKHKPAPIQRGWTAEKPRSEPSSLMLSPITLRYNTILQLKHTG